jgi:hypothetical protein
MNEEQWLACDEPAEMLAFLSGNASNRKLRLFVCAWTRRFYWSKLRHESLRHLVEVAERYADDLADKIELSAARRKFNRVRSSFSHAGTYRAIEAAWWAAYGLPMESAREIRGIQPRRATRKLQCALLREVFNPFLPVLVPSHWLSWDHGTVVRLARAAYDERILPAGTLANARLAVLADALEEAGCTDEQILTHLRGGREYYRGCFVLDALLGKS